jgi:hypothetical protein
LFVNRPYQNNIVINLTSYPLVATYSAIMSSEVDAPIESELIDQEIAALKEQG